MTPHEVSTYVRQRNRFAEDGRWFEAHLTALQLNAWGVKPKVTARAILGKPAVSITSFGSIQEAIDWAKDNPDRLPGR